MTVEIRVLAVVIIVIFLAACGGNFDATKQSQAIKWKDLGNELADNPDSALHYYRKSLSLCEAIGDKEIAAKVLGNIGITYEEENQYDSAFYYYEQALNLKIEMGLNAGYTLKGIAHIHDYIGDYRTSLEFYSAALTEAIGTKADKDIADLYNDIGITYNKLSMNDSAVSFFRKVLKYNIDEERNSRCFQNLAIAFDSLNVPDSAEFYFNKALNIRIELKYIDDIASTLTSWGDLYLRKGNIDSASYFKHRLENIQNYVADKEKKYQLWLFYARYFEKSGKVDSAYYYYRKYHDLYNEIYNQKKSMSHNIIRVRMKVAEKDRLIEAEKQAKIQSRFIGGFVAVLLFSSFMFFVQWNRRRNQRIKHQNEIEKQNIRNNSIWQGEEKGKSDLSNYIHGTVGGKVGSLVEAIKQLDIENETGKKKIIDEMTMLHKQVRYVSHELEPKSLEEGGLKDALSDMCNEISEIYSTKIKKVKLIYKIKTRLDKKKERQVYRIIQDLKNNIIAHAQATNIDIQLIEHPDKIIITVEDNGVGFDVSEALNKKGIGLRNIKAKTAELNGDIEINSAIGSGTSVMIELPKQNNTNLPK